MPRLSIHLFFVCLLSTCSLHGTTPLEWQVGVATRDITPKDKLWLSGYASRDRPAEGTLLPLKSKVLWITDAHQNDAVLITLDLIGIDRSLSMEIKVALAREFDLRQDAICLSTSHTHTGPVVGHNLQSMYFLSEDQAEKIDAYTTFLKSAILEAVRDARSSKTSATLAFGRGETDFAVNRRNNPEAKVPELRAADALLGPVDHDVPLLSVRNPSGNLLAVAFGYACHSTTLSSYEYSGDYGGFAQQAIEEAIPGSVALFWAGCGGDINPLPRREVELAEKYGDMLAETVIRHVEKDMVTLKPVIHTYLEHIPLRFSRLPNRTRLKEDTMSENRYVASRATLLLEQIEQGRPLESTYPYPVQLWTLGNELNWIMLGGEVVVDYSLEFKQLFGVDTTWTMAYANDVMAYIPSLRVLLEGGYEGEGAMVYYGLPSPWAPDVEDRIHSAVKRMIQRPIPTTNP